MAIGVTFPENEDVVTFWWKIERLVRVESKVDIYKKELGNYAGYRLRKVYWKDLHYWGMKISRDAVTHVGPYLDVFKNVSGTKSKSKSWLILLVSTCVFFCCWQRSDSATSGVILPSTKSSSNHSSNPSSPPPAPAKCPEKNTKLVITTKND